MRPDVVRRVLDAELIAARERRGGEAPRVLDVGGGSGVFAVPLAVAGCAVTVVEPSPNALATLHRRAHEAGVSERITAVQGDSDALGDLVAPESADLVLAHGLLEVVDDPAVTLAALAGTVAPGGALSVLVANRYATVLQRAISGRLVDARRLLDHETGVLGLSGEALLRRFDTEGLRDLLAATGLTLELLQGQSVVSDLVSGAALDTSPAAVEALAELERLAAETPPLRDIATRLHAIARH
ncbi:class I SAM-dependent methyltransferase [Actinokineospora globicatena]|uniref:class I SAM-dependent methyltransferase n=1 Tax=Actinokineospora globicatena TaxID=103729 RepID=UPI0020A53C7C|nr:methyltransferase domain-containing protein [Actinokineospora globicatena]MCP2304304.1 2-polyprenyl-3-methyl-5-hydroxy-6-metoxy-1,4-benzoquinol methylase [Actinokineospora globicatena]